MPQPLSIRSTKRQIWEEKSRLERVVDSTRQQMALLEREKSELEREAERLRKKNRLIEQVREELASLNERFELLTRLTKEINSLNPDILFEVCITKIPYLVNARAASLYVLDEEQGKLLLKKHSHNRTIDAVVDAKSGRSLMARVLAEARVRLFADLERGEPGGKQCPARPHRELYLTPSCIVAPLRAGDRVLGVLNLCDRIDGKPFSEKEDLPVVEQAAEILAISLRNLKLFEQAQRLAKTDSLTKLANHQTFFDALEREVVRAERYRRNVSVLMMDVDRFKLLNQNHGHLAGDEVLLHVVRVLRTEIRSTDTSARYGADEFAVLLPESDARAAATVAERVRARLGATHLRLGETEINVRLSQGVAARQQGQGASELLKAAEEALLQAKAEGGDRIRVR